MPNEGRNTSRHNLPRPPETSRDGPFRADDARATSPQLRAHNLPRPVVELPPTPKRLEQVEEQLLGQVAEVRAENAKLRAELDELKAKPAAAKSDDDEEREFAWW